MGRVIEHANRWAGFIAVQIHPKTGGRLPYDSILVGSAKLGSAKVGSAKVGSAKDDSAEVGSAKVGSAKVGSAKVSFICGVCSEVASIPRTVG